MNWLGRHREWLVSVVALLGAISWTWFSRAPTLAGAERLPNPRTGFPAPEISLPSLRGEQKSLASLRGQVVIVSLWASWCAPCQVEMPVLERLYEADRSKGLEILAVNSTVQDSVEAGAQFAITHGLTFPIVWDRDGDVSRRYLLQALPSTFIVDRRGIIRSVIVGGPTSQAVLESFVDPLLAERP